MRRGVPFPWEQQRNAKRLEAPVGGSHRALRRQVAAVAQQDAVAAVAAVVPANHGTRFLSLQLTLGRKFDVLQPGEVCKGPACASKPWSTAANNRIRGQQISRGQLLRGLLGRRSKSQRRRSGCRYLKAIIGSERFALNQTIQHGGGAKKEAPARGETGARGAASLPEVREPGGIGTLPLGSLAGSAAPACSHVSELGPLPSGALGERSCHLFGDSFSPLIVPGGL
jgi:hypothetical protein